MSKKDKPKLLRLLNEGFRYSEISSIMGLKNSTIRQTICRDKELKQAKMIGYNKGKSSKSKVPKYEWTFLYYLPEEHYIGITNNMVRRINSHKNTQGHMVDGFEIIAKFERRVDAHYVETMFHIRGYQGFRDLSKNNETFSLNL